MCLKIRTITRPSCIDDASNFALAAFRQAITEWNPPGTFSAGMLAMCERFEHGLPMVGNGTGSAAMRALQRPQLLSVSPRSRSRSPIGSIFCPKESALVGCCAALASSAAGRIRAAWRVVTARRAILGV